MRSKSSNCIIKSWFEEMGNAFYTGHGWLMDRSLARRYSLPEVEQVVQNMRDDDVMVFWERYDTGRSSL